MRCCVQTSHPPTYYVPRADLADEAQLVEKRGGGSFCEWKGRAVYYDLCVGGEGGACSRGAAWAYPNPTERVNRTSPMGGQILALGRAKALEDLLAL